MVTGTSDGSQHSSQHAFHNRLMDTLMLFTDGSVNAQSQVGYGAYLLVNGMDADQAPDSLKDTVKIKRFENTSSTKLELQIVVWALNALKHLDRKIVLYTDSQNIIELPRRRERLENNDYYSKNNKRLNHYKLYQEFYRITDGLDFEMVKVKGHKATSEKNHLDAFFTQVDRASRNAQRTQK